MERPLPLTGGIHDTPVNTTQGFPDVFSAGDIARAAGVHPRQVEALARSGVIQPLSGGRFFTETEAIAAVRAFTGALVPERPLFGPAAAVAREPFLPFATSGAVHVAMLALIAAMTSLTVAGTQARAPDALQETHMVFLVAPGPGGGGGGGGLKQPAPPPPAEHHGAERLRSPIAMHRPAVQIARAVHETPPPRIDPPPVVPPAEPPPPARADAIQPVFAPVVPAAPDPRDRAGLPWHSAPAVERDSRGSGTGGGIGSGQGTGLGPGDGNGIGPGVGGGTGGGPYRPGSGITAPSILREVRPDYTDEGRRRGVEGDVVVEVVVRADGSVGSVTLLQGLGAGLDQRAIDAVRQWRFNPARRYGTPVDVIVEVAVEFRLR